MKMRLTFLVVNAFLVLLIFVAVRASAAEPVEGNLPFEVLMDHGQVSAVKIAYGNGGITDPANGKFIVTWFAYSHRGGKNVSWFVTARKERKGPYVELPEAIVEQLKKTVDYDGKTNKPWKVEVTKSEDTGQPVTIIHTSYDWSRRFCNEDDNANPPKLSCGNAAQILEGPIRSFREIEHVTNWDVDGYSVTTTKP